MIMKDLSRDKKSKLSNNSFSCLTKLNSHNQTIQSILYKFDICLETEMIRRKHNRSDSKKLDISKL